MFLSICFSLSKHNINILLLNFICSVSSSYHGKINSKNEKNKKYPSVRKVARTTGTTPMPLPVVVKTLVVVVRKKEKLVKAKPKH